MCSGGEEDNPDLATPRTPRPPPSPGHTTWSTSARSPSPPFRTVDSPPAAVRPPSSPPCSVYHSLSIVPVGALTAPGGHGLPASGLPAPRRRAHRAPSGRRRAPGGLPGRGGGGRRRSRPAAVRRARVPGVPDCAACSRRGVARFRCEGCAREHLVPFSCKGRGWCPSCGGRRMTERAAHLVDAVLPWVPVRQWVLTMPYRLRYQMAWNHGLSRAVLRRVHARAARRLRARRSRARH